MSDSRDKDVDNLAVPGESQHSTEQSQADRHDQEAHKIADKLQEQLAPSALTDDPGPIPFVRGILDGSLCEIEDAQYRRAIVLQAYIDWLGRSGEALAGNSAASSRVGSLVNLLSPEIEVLPPPLLCDAAHRIADHLNEGATPHPRVYELLTKLCNQALVAEPSQDIGPVLNQLFAAHWTSSIALGLASALNDIELARAQLDAVIKRMHKQFKYLELEEFPPFIYQMLLLSRKGSKRLVLSTIFDFFNKHDPEALEAPEATVRHMEGTIMLHLTFAIKQDQDLGNELLKYFRNNGSQLMQTFSMACILSVAKIHRMEDAVFEFLRSSIISAFKDADKVEKNAWILQYMKLGKDRIRDILLDVAEKSILGWDQVVQPITQLALSLIDTAVSQGTPARSTSTTLSHAYEAIVDLATQVLLRLFKLQRIIRQEVLEQIISRIISRANSAPQFLKLLERICKEQRHTIEPFAPNLKETLDYLTLLPLPIAERFLLAIKPLAKANDQLRDTLMLVLRKSMFSRDVDSRKISVTGLLGLLEEQLEHDDAAETGSTYEVLALLRRCFGQQSDIRLAAYEGLGRLVKYGSLRGDILELLSAQFMEVYEADEGIQSAIKLQACVEGASSGKMAEPVHVLLAALLKALREVESGDVDTVTQDCAEKCQAMFKSLAHRLSKNQLEDYALDKSASYDLATHAGARNHQSARLLLGCYEAAMEHEFFVRGENMDSFELMLNLYKRHDELLCTLKENVTNDKGRKVPTHVSEYSVLSFAFVAKVSQCMFMQGTIQTPSRVLRSDISFIQYIVSNTHHCLDTIEKDEVSFQLCGDLAKVYMHILNTEDSDSSFLNYQAKKGPSVLSMVIDALRLVLETVVHAWPDQTDAFMARLAYPGDPTRADSSGASRNATVRHVLKQFEDIVTKYINDRPPLYKEATNVVRIVAFMSEQLNRKADDFRDCVKDTLSWLVSLIKDRAIEDTGLARELFHLYINMSADVDDFNAIQDIALDIPKVLGDLEITESQEDTEVSLTHAMLNQKTCNTITVLLFAFLDESVDELNWCVSRLKQKDADGEEDETQRVAAFEGDLWKRMLSRLTIAGEACRALLTGIYAESLLKLLSKTYRMLLTSVKFKLTRSRRVCQAFIDLMATAGGVTDRMYRFLTIYGQHETLSHLEAPVMSKKKKRGVGSIAGGKMAKVVRESRMIPNLIFAVEQFERHLIQLSRKSKVDMMQYMKRSTSRDFKIKLDMFQPEEHEEEENEKHNRPYHQANNEDRDEEDGEDDEDGRNVRRRISP